MPQLEMGMYAPNLVETPLTPPSDEQLAHVDKAVELITAGIHGIFTHLGIDAPNAQLVEVKPRLVIEQGDSGRLAFFVHLTNYPDSIQEYHLKTAVYRDGDGEISMLVEPFEGSGMDESISVRLDDELADYEESIAYFAYYKTLQSN